MDYLFSDSLEVLGMECEEGDSGKHTRMVSNSIFKVREVFALTNQLGTFFGNNKENFQKIFSTTFQGQRKPLSHHGDVIGAEIEKAR